MIKSQRCWTVKSFNDHLICCFLTSALPYMVPVYCLRTRDPFIKQADKVIFGKFTWPSSLEKNKRNSTKKTDGVILGRFTWPNSLGKNWRNSTTKRQKIQSISLPTFLKTESMIKNGLCNLIRNQEPNEHVVLVIHLRKCWLNVNNRFLVKQGEQSPKKSRDPAWAI